MENLPCSLRAGHRDPFSVSHRPADVTERGLAWRNGLALQTWEAIRRNFWEDRLSLSPPGCRRVQRPDVRGPSAGVIRTFLLRNGFDVDCLIAVRTELYGIRHSLLNLEAAGLVVGRAHGEVGEQILAAVIGSDQPKAFELIQPLEYAGRLYGRAGLSCTLCHRFLRHSLSSGKKR